LLVYSSIAKRYTKGGAEAKLNIIAEREREREADDELLLPKRERG
jgi:hypothetical protein